MTTPMVGDSLHYYPDTEDLDGMYTVKPMNRIRSEVPFDAVIAFVHSDRIVNLSVLDHRGQHHVRENVVLLQVGESPMQNQPFCAFANYLMAQAETTTPAERGVAPAQLTSVVPRA